MLQYAKFIKGAFMRSCLLFLGLMLICVCFAGMVFLFLSAESSRYGMTLSAPEITIQPPPIQDIRTSTQTSTPITVVFLSPTPTMEGTLPPPAPTNTSTPEFVTLSPTAISPPTLTPFPDIFIEAEWPSRLQVGTSDLVKVSLTKGGDYYVVKVETPGHTAVVSSPMPLNTPVFESTGVAYETVFIANLAGANFIIEPSNPIEKSLNEPNLVWTWSISSKPNVSDFQIVNVTIDVQFRHPGSSTTSERTTVWDYPLYIDVYQPLISQGQISVMSLFSGFLGSGLSIPWILEQLKKRKPKSKAKKKSNK